ncbi:MAG TPA: DUF1206 domain-containing protein [Mycobacteriales bacterium]
MRSALRLGKTAGTTLEAAALALTRGDSGVWLRAVTRLGLIARAIVYLLVGYLALRIALAEGGRTGSPASSAGAVQAAAGHSWGRLALLLLAAGLGAYALTQLVEAVFRPSHARSAFNRWRQRAVSSWGFVLYAAFCLSTAWLLVATHSRQTAESEHHQDTDVTAALLRLGVGRAILILAGIALVAAGIEMARRSILLNFRERFTKETLPPPVAFATRPLGAFGCAARAVVFVLGGFFLTKAAILYTPHDTKGLDAVFRSIASATFGPLLLGAIASGLLAYGIYCLIEARYRDLTPGR